MRIIFTAGEGVRKDDTNQTHVSELRDDIMYEKTHCADSRVLGETERFPGVRGKTFTFQCIHPFPGKFNHSNQKSIPVSDESPRLNQNNKLNKFLFQESNKFLSSAWRELGPG